MARRMKYRVVSVTGNIRGTMAEVVSEAWAKTFADDLRRWIAENGGNGITNIVIEEIKEN